MDMRSINEQLNRVDSQVNELIGNIREELMGRENSSQELTTGQVKSLLKYIVNPLRNININGDEELFDRMLDISDDTMYQLDSIIENKEYAKGDKLSPSELNTFITAKKVMQVMVVDRLSSMDKLYEEIIHENLNGKLQEKVSKDKVEELGEEIVQKEKEIYEDRKILDMKIKLEPEFTECKKTEKIGKTVDLIDSDIKQIEIDILDPNFTQEDIEQMRKKLAELLVEKEEYILENNKDMQEKEEFMIQPDETDEEYVERLGEEFNKKRENNKYVLWDKIDDNRDEEIKVINSDENFTELKTVTMDERFNMNADINEFINSFEKDVAAVKLANISKEEEKTNLEEEKDKYKKFNERVSGGGQLVNLAYKQKDNGKEPGRIGKFLQRSAFRIKHPENLFAKKKDLEKEMRFDNSGISRRDILKGVEKAQKSDFKTKYQVETNARRNVYKKIERREKVEQNKDNGR